MENARKHLKKAHTRAKKATRKRPVRVGLLILTIFLALFTINEIADRYLWRPVKDPKYGVTFVRNYSTYLGLDWQENFTALLDDMKLRNFRLVSYWTVGEPERGKFEFGDLDWQMNEVAKRGGYVSLAIGLRQPRWPECHEPGWAKPLPDDQWKQALSAYIKVVVERYKDHPALGTYQLENEAVNNWFGECKPNSRHVDRQRLKDEFAMVKELDPEHPVYMSLSDQHGLPWRQPVPDAYGFSVYRTVYNQFGPDFYVTYPTPIWYHRLRAAFIEWKHKRPIFIHELQMEPWGYKGVKDLTIAEQDHSMSVQKLRDNISFGRRIGKQNIYLWGGEWWYWRKVVLNDPTIWETVREELQKP